VIAVSGDCHDARADVRTYSGPVLRPPRAGNRVAPAPL